MPDPIRIALDESPPTEEGWYFVLHPESIPFTVRVIRFDGQLGVADPCCGTWKPFDGSEANARWSRRIEIGGA